MNLALRGPMTAAEFLEWEERQEVKHEFDGIAPEAMAGGTVAHAAVQRNLAIAYGRRLAGSACQFFGSDLKLQTLGGYRYPDGMIVCGALPVAATAVTDPFAIFEVLSPATATKDLGVKNEEYRALASVRHYVLLEQDRMAGLIFSRDGDDWVGRQVSGAEAAIDIPELGAAPVKLQELYVGLDLAPATEARSGR